MLNALVADTINQFTVGLQLYVFFSHTISSFSFPIVVHGEHYTQEILSEGFTFGCCLMAVDARIGCSLVVTRFA